MENRMERLNRLAQMATALRHREKIDRIIRTFNEADDAAQHAAETMKRIMNKHDSQP